MDWDREDVLRDDEIELEFFDERVERVLAAMLYFLNLVRRSAASLETTEELLLQCEDVRLTEKSFLEKVTRRGRRIELSSEPETLVPFRFQNPRPLGRFESDTIGALEPG